MHNHFRKDLLKHIPLKCTECSNTLSYPNYSCSSCGISFELKDQRLYFTNTWTNSKPYQKDWLNSTKELFKKKAHQIYPLLIWILSPVASTVNPIKINPNRKNDAAIAVNLGSGTSSLTSSVINVDIAPYTPVDIVASIDNTPFTDNSIDTIYNLGVLEHVPNPEEVVGEMKRILKPGGAAVCFIPFMQGIHASPYDFQRYTPAGIQILFKGFTIQAIYPLGPTSSLIWILQEWLATILSFGVPLLYKIILPITWILSPLKLLDHFLRHYPSSDNIASGYYFVAVKNNE